MVVTKKKINWLLILQGWAMLWVVIGHSPLGKVGEGPSREVLLYKFAYSFHMPLFMLVSGWLFYLTRLKYVGGKWSYYQIIKDKSLRLILPGLVFSIVALLAKIIFSGEVDRQVDLNLSSILYSYLYPYDNPLRELWFIVTLFWFFVLTPLWQWTLKNRSLSLIALVILMVLHFIHPSYEFMCFNRVFSMAIWFYMGLLLSKFDIIDKLFINHIYFTFCSGILIYIIGLILGVPFITTCGGISLSFGIALIADRYIPSLFFSFRNYTYQIFLMGIFAQIVVKVLYM